ncbi:asparagine synthase (glutamine-hydrolyzing) [Hoeflea sp. TYP-13]|uniref:asparagine synthase (glutamine-hydrolyzing) n=1 Tax=Hoeflea sp. TYP-13 TaxID=3230023 RepID=UPI0034C6A77A
MCGLAGFLDFEGTDTAVCRRVGLAMADSLAHRGPDAEGVWVEDGICLAHRRLAILDLSEAGQQPMTSACGRYVIVFNGEIYNHQQLRNELDAERPGYNWRGHSDTETLLACIAHWGLEPALKRSIGMFALALWDRRYRSLSLARDRFGEKPLYYGWIRGAFVFGSELKAIKAHPGFEMQICRAALARLLQYTYVPAPFSIWRGIYKLEPGCTLILNGSVSASPPGAPLRPGMRFGNMAVDRYWSVAQAAAVGARGMILDEAEGLRRLESALMLSVRRQMLSDVPLGAFLSGGVDSSTVVAMMQQQASAPVQTFTVGYEDAGYNEAPHARAVARHLGTNHTEVVVTDFDAKAVIPDLPQLYDEPFADSSQIPTHLICRAARSSVTVALSGDAGDEIFGGYNRYFWGPRVWNRLAWLPFPVRKILGAGFTSIPIGCWDRLGKDFAGLLPGQGGIAHLGDKAHKLAARLSRIQNIDDLYRSLITEWSDPATLVCGFEDCSSDQEGPLDDPLPGCVSDSSQARMMLRDTVTYLPDDILCKVDRAAMGVGLETRVPLLDHNLAELAWRLPMSMKIRGNEGKWALRQILYRHVPRELIERPKAGFALPVGKWLRGPLRDWAETLLDPSRMKAEGHLNPEPVQRIWNEHLSGRREWTPRLWSVLMFQAWLEAQR